MRLPLIILLIAAQTSVVSPAHAEELRQGGKLLLAGGATSVEGGAGGGLATWAVIGGNETDAGIGGGAHLTYANLSDFDYTGYGVKIGLFDRVELAVSRQRFDTRDAGPALGLPQGFTFGQDIFSAKVRLFGDAIYDQDGWLPQVSFAVQHKIARRDAVLAAVGARDDSGTDYVLSATKLLLARSLVIGGALRLTKANQFGLLGFGGDRKSGYSVEFEGSAGYLLSRRLLVGGEYRTKPDNLGFAREGDAYDVFAAYALHRNLTVTAGYLDLGDIATFTDQRGAYLSLQAGF